MAVGTRVRAGDPPLLVHGYLDPASNHEQAAYDLNLSRAAYFRRLKQASKRVAEYLAQGTSR